MAHLPCENRLNKAARNGAKTGYVPAGGGWGQATLINPKGRGSREAASKIWRFWKKIIGARNLDNAHHSATPYSAEYFLLRCSTYMLGSRGAPVTVSHSSSAEGYSDPTL